MNCSSPTLSSLFFWEMVVSSEINIKRLVWQTLKVIIYSFTEEYIPISHLLFGVKTSINIDNISKDFPSNFHMEVWVLHPPPHPQTNYRSLQFYERFLSTSGWMKKQPQQSDGILTMSRHSCISGTLDMKDQADGHGLMHLIREFSACKAPSAAARNIGIGAVRKYIFIISTMLND